MKIAEVKKINCSLIIFGMVTVTAFISFNCKEKIVGPNEKSLYTTELKGNVILQNQSENSNVLVYLDSLDRGVATDSNGNYSIEFMDTDTIYSGIFKIFYFVNEYEMDSSEYVLLKGKVKLDSLDVNSEGNIPSKELEQLILVQGWTDKEAYKIGDTIEFTARFSNVASRTVHLFIYSAFNQLGWISLYNEAYTGFNLSPCLIVDADTEIDLPSQSFYEGKVRYIIPDGNYCTTEFIPLPPLKYIVVADLFIEGRLTNFWTNKMEHFIGMEWYMLHRGSSPKLDYFPNKYKFPIITIIE